MIISCTMLISDLEFVYRHTYSMHHFYQIAQSTLLKSPLQPRFSTFSLKQIFLMTFLSLTKEFSFDMNKIKIYSFLLLQHPVCLPRKSNDYLFVCSSTSFQLQHQKDLSFHFLNCFLFLLTKRSFLQHMPILKSLLTSPNWHHHSTGQTPQKSKMPQNLGR